MAMSSLSVVTNANRLRRWNPPRLAATPPRAFEPLVDVREDHELAVSELLPATDPICGMSVEPDHAAAQASHLGRTYYFCSTACRDEFVADPAHVLSRPQHAEHGRGHH
jgi:Cu+-exporting ATPase